MPAAVIPKIFYQSSMPRAGSTLLQNILAQNPDFYVTPTSGLLELVFGARLNYTNNPEFKAQDDALMKKAFLAFSRAGMEAYFKALTDKPYVLDKSRGWGVHFDLLSLIFNEEPKIICLVRDLRQILASMEKKFRQNPDKHRSIENHANLSGTTTLKRAVMNLQTPPVGLALDRLAEIHQRGWHKKILFIRYEDLTAQPKQTLQKVYAYLGVPEFAHNFENVPQVTQEDDQAYGIPGLHEIRPKVESLQNDFLSILGKDAVRFVQGNYAWYFTLFGYQTSPV
ncbi:MAG TPA: sulfotransferase [Candidatus Methylacidiphilales bacterium]|jgi:sulfotransferase|nr:sulfotransferase [Candidatus Methylacidiphilales bacterium]